MIAFGREVCGHLESALRREWLVTNGIGGYACGTVAGANTRTYHGLLVAALHPPLGRALLFAKLDATVRYGDATFELDTNEWADGTVHPIGHRAIESFELDAGVPTWTYALGEARIVKRLWMDRGHNTTWVTYEHARGGAPLEMSLTALVTCRDHHGGSPPDAAPIVRPLPDGVRVDADEGAPPLFLRSDGAVVEPLGVWYRGLRHRAESERGLPDLEDVYGACRLRIRLEPGETRAVAASTDEAPRPWRESLDALRARAQDLVARADLGGAPAWVRQLVLAADQFVVERPPDGGTTVIAGYPWFADWGRDAMIALPGLCLATGRREEAASILRTFARHVDRGMLPNRFPDAGDTPDYNTADATLWLFEAVSEWMRVTGDWDLARELYPVLADVVEWHVRGTRYGIRAEPDGLVRAGTAGMQLTWMDAKVGDWVVTPRIGKPVEINALWIHALRVLGRLAESLGRTREADDLAERANLAGGSFASRFWYDGGGHLYDVVDGPEGDDPSLRPNQLVACAVRPSLLSRRAAQSVVRACARALHTSFGLRTLDPADPRYVGACVGDPVSRDAAYHQGTVWPWLVVPFVAAHINAFGDPISARSYLAPFRHHLRDAGLGSVSEIFDGDPPHMPRGCFAQAWSVAAVLQAWRMCDEAEARLRQES